MEDSVFKRLETEIAAIKQTIAKIEEILKTAQEQHTNLDLSPDVDEFSGSESSESFQLDTIERPIEIVGQTDSHASEAPTIQPQPTTTPQPATPYFSNTEELFGGDHALGLGGVMTAEEFVMRRDRAVRRELKNREIE